MRMNRLMAACTVALLGGCAASPPLGDTPLVGGQIQGWPLWRGDVLVYLPSEPVANPTENWPVDVNGNFSIMLPGKDALQPQVGPPAFSLGGTDCTGQVSVLPATVSSVVANFKAIDSGPIDLSLSSATTRVLYVFFDQAASASGTISCPTNAPGSAPATVTVNLQVIAGWNTLLLNQTGEIGNLTASSGPLPADLRWKLGDSDGQPGALCLQDAECGSGRCFSTGNNFSKCSCLFLEESCLADSDCCKGAVCTKGRCCVAQGAACNEITDCCKGLCIDNVCG